ncbi:hypothetical protein RCH21_002057 [Arthrobacter sp. PL16]|nr:hypothetical protein [Arthrobacter sp. PL16]
MGAGTGKLYAVRSGERMEKQGTRARYLLEHAGDYLCLQWSSGITVEAADVVSATTAVSAASPDGPRPLLVSINLLAHVTAEAKQLLIRDICSSRIAIIGADDMGRVLTAFTHRSVTPTRYFTDDQEATEWLLDETREHPSIFGESYGVEKAFSSEMRDGVLWVTWAQAMHITDAIAENIVLRAEFMNPISCPPMLLELHQVMSATDSAMRILADGLNIAALAVVSADPRGQALITYYKQRSHPPYATRHFRTTGEAEHWLTLIPTP